ncbi:MAG: hypothetical protein R3F60_05835 [bacterium]
MTLIGRAASQRSSTASISTRSEPGARASSSGETRRTRTPLRSARRTWARSVRRRGPSSVHWRGSHSGCWAMATASWGRPAAARASTKGASAPKNTAPRRAVRAKPAASPAWAAGGPMGVPAATRRPPTWTKATAPSRAGSSQ